MWNVYTAKSILSRQWILSFNYIFINTFYLVLLSIRSESNCTPLTKQTNITASTLRRWHVATQADCDVLSLPKCLRLNLRTVLFKFQAKFADRNTLIKYEHFRKCFTYLTNWYANQNYCWMIINKYEFRCPLYKDAGPRSKRY